MDMIKRANRVAEIITNKGIAAKVMIKNNNGVEKIGFTLGDGIVRPTIYPNLETTNDLDKIADNIIDSYNQHKDDGNMFNDIVDKFTDFNSIKQDIIPALVKECTEDVVSRDFLDLKIVYRYMINNDASILIRKQHLEVWDKTETDIYDIALNNVRDSYVDIPLPGDVGMRVILNTKRNYGATALLFPELFEKYGNDARILPSSIHEVIVIENSQIEDNSLVEMIMLVNETELNPEEILSNHPYRYEDGIIKGVA